MILRKIEGDGDDARWAARLMASTDPWLRLGRTEEMLLPLILDPTRDSFVATLGGENVGALVLALRGPFSGYLQAICVHSSYRGRGIGTELLAMAEEKMFAVSPNAFLCVSSFNTGARKLYERLGYQFIGEIPDYLVRGHSEYLMRKCHGPWSEFVKKD